MEQAICDYKTAVSILGKAKECSSMIELCNNHGVSIREFELSLFENSLPFPEFYTPLEQRLLDSYKQYKKGGKTDAELAKHFGVSPSTLRYYLLKLELLATPRQSVDVLEDVAYWMKTRGGSVQSALNAVGSRITPYKARALLLGSGFDCDAYQHAWKRYGNWQVQPARPRKCKDPNRWLLYVRCLDCGTYEWRSSQVLGGGQSKRCASCAAKNTFATKVKDHLTGEVFPNSTSAAKHYAPITGISYQAIQTHVRRYGFYKVDDCHLEALDIQNNDYYNFVPDVCDEVAIGQRLLVKPFPNDDTSAGPLHNRDGLLELAKHNQPVNPVKNKAL